MTIIIQQPLNLLSESNHYCGNLLSPQNEQLQRKQPDEFHHTRPSSRRRSYPHSSPLILFLTLLFILFTTAPVEAKFAFSRNNSINANKKRNKEENIRTDSTTLSKGRNKPKIVLHPRPNQKRTITVRHKEAHERSSQQVRTATNSQPISLEATLTKNESGQHVLVLTPESTDAVQLAVAEQSAKEAPPVQQATQVLFYNPEELPKTKAGEPPGVPNKIYDKEGREVSLNAGEEVDLILPHKPPPLPNESDGSSTASGGTSTTSGGSSTTSGGSSTTSGGSSTTSGSSSKSDKIRRRIANPQTQDQMIIISTVATMALLIGALSARRLRSRQFLSFCIENENLEDDLAFDAAYTTQSTVGASSLYGGYDTFGDGNRYGGDLRWRGDLEKFDV